MSRCKLQLQLPLAGSDAAHMKSALFTEFNEAIETEKAHEVRELNAMDCTGVELNEMKQKMSEKKKHTLHVHMNKCRHTQWHTCACVRTKGEL